jgi:predicted  nucleic acid-binding Zn-ribbon protein
MTPTFLDRRFSATDSTRSEDEFFPVGPSSNRPLSASEQHFLVKSHKALLARITDLEQALTNRRRISSIYTYSSTGASRPSSIISDATPSEAGSEQSDEPLNLVMDLKTERDELKRDIDGWRTRVGDMEKQMTMLTTRIDAERRDAWVARSQARLLEVAKSAVEKKLEEAEKVLEEIRAECQTLKAEKETLANENQEIMAKTHDLEEQLKVTLVELTKLQEKKSQPREKVLTTAASTASMYFNRPRSSHGRNATTAFSSTDSAESSATEVEMEFANDCEAKFSFMLKAVQEEDESNDNEEDNGLAGYEDEEESDASFRSSSSFDLSDSQSESTLLPTALSTPRPHDSHFSLSEPADSEHTMDQPLPSVSPPSWSNWTFPRTAHGRAVQHNKKDSVDHFFGCLENESSSDGDSSPHSPSHYSIERSKSLFCDALKESQDDDDCPFFMFHSVVGVIADDKRLDIVLEEEEDTMSDDDTSDSEMFGEMGGIRITLSPPRPEDDGVSDVDEPLQPLVQATHTEMAPQLPMLNFGDEDDTGFSFDKALERSQFEEKTGETDVPTVVIPRPEIVVSPLVEMPAAPVSAHVQTPSSTIPRSIPPRSSPPSAIPRFACHRQSPDTTSSSRDLCATPPSKRGGAVASFIPQPIRSPSPTRTPPPTKSQIARNVHFIRQPQKKPLTSNILANVDCQETSANGSPPASYTAIHRLTTTHTATKTVNRLR